ncbi:hypothetical protein C8Q80DRAFT_1270539 [Daedaleopsis nitida]|nr:hypothetical protein C8Q80DRAFT_1270539 [Daedaleopsis nitida]
MEEKRRELMRQNKDFLAGLEIRSNLPPIPIPRRTQTPSLSALFAPPDDASPNNPSVAGPFLQTVPAPTASMAQPQDRAKTPSPHVAGSDPREGSCAAPRLTCRGWSITAFCDSYKNFQPVRRISALIPPSELQEALHNHDSTGEPLIIEDWHKHPQWREGLVSMEWLLENRGNKEIHVRNVHNRKDTTMSLNQFVETSRAQDVYNVPGESERLYWKDGECPLPWKEWLQATLPPSILPGCANDLLRHMEPSEAVESLLCYLGIGDTYTPAHKDLCASSGHNLMCFSENDGSSFWFMTATASAPNAAEYFQKKLGQELDWETHVTTVEEFGQAPFTVYVAEQKVGDLVLVPSRSVHQVVNRGGLAMKTSWSRMTLDNLKAAYRSELPMVCRLEQYRVKTVLYRSMLCYTEELEGILASAAPKLPMEDHEPSEGDGETATPSQPIQHSKAERLHSLIRLFDEVLCEEYHAGHRNLRHVPPQRTIDQSQPLQPIPASESLAGKDPERTSSSNLACDFCGADIFQSFFECRTCRASDQDDEAELQIGDGLLVCPGCYVEGRTCDCEEMEPIQCRPFRVLLQDRNRAAKAVFEVLPSGRSQRSKKKLNEDMMDK